MVENDFSAFIELLDSAMSINPAWKPLAPKAKALFFKALEPYPLDLVSKAMTAHIRDPQCGMYQPTPAHIVAKIEAVNTGPNCPGADEAWSIAMMAEDEAETVVWTEEMRDAFAICRPVFAAGDKVGARMAFKDAYTRLTAKATREGRAPKWECSLGHNSTRREAVISQAVQRGLLPAPNAAALLPPPPQGQASAEGMVRVKAELAKLVSASDKAQAAREEAAAAERETVAARKRVLAQQARAI